MLRSKSLKTVSRGLVCMFLACIVSAQGTAPKTFPVKITTKENAPDVYKDVECLVHEGNGINGGYQFSVHRRRPEPALGIADKVAKEIVKRIAKDLRRKPVLSPGRANRRLECAKMAA